MEIEKLKENFEKQIMRIKSLENDIQNNKN